VKCHFFSFLFFNTTAALYFFWDRQTLLRITSIVLFKFVCSSLLEREGGRGQREGGELIGRSISNWTPYYFNAIILSTVSHVYINFYLSVCLSLCFFHLSLVPAFLDHFSSSSAIVLFCWVSFYFTFLGFQWKERGRTKERKKKREREMDRRKERQKRRKGGKRKEAPVLICSRGICFRGLTSSD